MNCRVENGRESFNDQLPVQLLGDVPGQFALAGSRGSIEEQVEVPDFLPVGLSQVPVKLIQAGHQFPGVPFEV